MQSLEQAGLVTTQLSKHPRIPGLGYNLISNEGFLKREELWFQTAGTEYVNGQQALLKIDHDQGLLDVDSSWIQFDFGVAEQLVAGNVAAERFKAVPNCSAGSLIQRLQIIHGGQTLIDISEFAILDKIIKMSKYSSDEPAMSYFPPRNRSNVILKGADFAAMGTTISNSAEFTALNNPGADFNCSQAVFARVDSDLQKSRKFYGSNAANNIIGAVRDPLQDKMTRCIIKLDDISLFSSRQYYPLMFIKGALQISITFAQPNYALHNPSMSYIGTPAFPTTFKVVNLGICCSVLYPSEALTLQLKEQIEKGEMLYAGQCCETNRSTVNGASGSIVVNTAMSRLQQVEAVLIEKDDQVVSRTCDFLNAEIAPDAVSRLYRGQQWFSPFSSIQNIHLLVNGSSFPSQYGQTMDSEQMLFQYAKENLNSLPGLQHSSQSFFLDSQIASFNLMKDTGSNPLRSSQDVSGINTSSSGQITFKYQFATQPVAQTELVLVTRGVIILQVAPNGQLIVYK